MNISSSFNHIGRHDRPDRLFSHREAKNRAVVAAIEQAHRLRRPVLVGTASVQESDALASGC